MVRSKRPWAPGASDSGAVPPGGTPTVTAMDGDQPLNRALPVVSVMNVVGLLGSSGAKNAVAVYVNRCVVELMPMSLASTGISTSDPSVGAVAANRNSPAPVALLTTTAATMPLAAPPVTKPESAENTV